MFEKVDKYLIMQSLLWLVSKELCLLHMVEEAMGASEHSGGCKCHNASETKLEGLGYSNKSATFWTYVSSFTN